MKAKKVISMILTGAAVVGLLAGCGSSSGSSQENSSASVQEDTAEETENTAQEEQTETETTEEPAAEESEENADSTEATADSEETGNVLVVYYSATGNTEEVANIIADTTGGDLFELEPEEPYTSEDLDWTNNDSRVSVEHANEDQRDVPLVSTTVENWDSYDTVFIGYPIWWGIAAWPVNQFVENNDFTGKTVIPFCTSASSGLGESGELLAELAGTGDWQEGMRFRSGVSEEDVQAWVEGLGL